MQAHIEGKISRGQNVFATQQIDKNGQIFPLNQFKLKRLRRRLIMDGFPQHLFAKSKTNDDRNINVALETVLEFDGKEADGDKQFLNNMQTFLEKIKNTIGFQRAKPKGSQNSMNTDDFVKHLFSALSGLDKKEMDIISKTIEAEIKRRFDDDEDFRELVQIPAVRRSLSSGLQTLRKSPKKLWSSFARSLQPSSETSGNPEKDETSMRSTIQNWSNNFMSWVNNMFHKNDPPMKQNLYKVIDDINDYSKTKGLEQRILQPHQKDPYSSEDEQQAKQKKVKEIDEVLRNPEKLVSIVKNALRTLLFDQYSNLDSKKRKLIQLRLQSFWMDPDEKDGKEKHNADKREQKKKHKDSSKDAPRPPKRNRDKHHDKKKGLKSRFVIQHTTTKRPRHHKPRFEDEMKKGKSHGYQNILRMKKEKDDGSSLTDTKEDGFKFPDDRSDPSPGSPQKSDYFEPNKKSGEKSSELIDHSSSSEHQPITSGTTSKSPRTEMPPKKSMGVLQDSEYSHSSNSNPHNSGYNSGSKELLRDRTHKKYTTSQKPNDLIKTTTTKPTIPTRTESSISFESQSRESTTEKSLMDSLREIIQDEPKPYFNLDKEKDSSKQNQEKSQESSEFFDSSKSKEKTPQSKSKAKAKAIRSGKNRVEEESKSGSVSKSESKSVEHKSKSEKHSNENTKNKEIKKVEEETLESWSEFDSKDEKKHYKANTQKSDEEKGSGDSKTHREENKVDSSSEWLEKPVVKAKSNEKPQPKQSRISNEKKRISHPGKETTSATKPRELVSPQVRIIETDTAVINVVKEDEVFTDHSAEKNRGKNKTNEQDKKGKVKPAMLSKKQDRVNRAQSQELRTKLPNITYVDNDADDLYDDPSAKTQSKSLTTKKDTYILAYDDHRTTTTQTSTTTQRSTTTKKDTYIVNSNLAPYNIEVSRVIKDIMNQRDSQEVQRKQGLELKTEKHEEERKEPKISLVQGDSTSWVNNTVQQDNLDMNASLSPVLSAESQALYKALEEQERKHGLDNLLDNADLIDLQKLNISFINQNSLEGNDNRKYTLALKNKLK